MKKPRTGQKTDIKVGGEYNKYLQCVCPKCRKLHYKSLFWVGRGIPRRYCKFCQMYYVDGNGLIEEHTIHL